jgi:hypothetical protein
MPNHSEDYHVSQEVVKGKHIINCGQHDDNAQENHLLHPSNPWHTGFILCMFLVSVYLSVFSATLSLFLNKATVETLLFDYT